MGKEKIISAFTAKRKYFNLNSKLENSGVYIIDFYNIYCNFVKFDKYKIFSKETFSTCINLLINYFDRKSDTCIIVSKNIYEVDIEDIKHALNGKSNVVYIIAEDKYTVHSKNKERDDYTCIMLYNLLKKRGPDTYLDHSKSLLLVNSNSENISIITNDTYKNYRSLLKNVKPFNMKIINSDGAYDVPINRRIISMYNTEINGKSVDRIGFNFINKKK